MKFSDFPQAVIKENVDYTVKEITNVIKKYGPRESGNENCYAAQKHIKKEMDTFCDGTEFESYKMAPKAFLHFTKLVSVVIFLAIVACAILMYTSIITPLLEQCIVCVVVFVGLFITVMGPTKMIGWPIINVSPCQTSRANIRESIFSLLFLSCIVEIPAGHFSAYGLRFLFKENLQISL